VGEDFPSVRQAKSFQVAEISLADTLSGELLHFFTNKRYQPELEVDKALAI
jgi:hypothetical protein